MNLIKQLFSRKSAAVTVPSEPVITYSEYYKETICPRCKHILDKEKARYKTRCCYLCGHANGLLFDCEDVVMRDKYINGKFVEHEIKQEQTKF